MLAQPSSAIRRDGACPVWLCAINELLRCDDKIGQVRYRAPRDAIPPTPPGPEGSNGNGLVRVQRVARLMNSFTSFLLVQFSSTVLNRNEAIDCTNAPGQQLCIAQLEHFFVS